MTSLIEKARLGRMNALAGLPSGQGADARIRNAIRHEKVTFISSRARTAADSFTA
ncbi:MAG: hypothetical protein N2422_04745 [Rhodobacteraceae bacterium]|nr:hypothetical protein [Paracoccaceae bacterium]